MTRVLSVHCTVPQMVRQMRNFEDSEHAKEGQQVDHGEGKDTGAPICVECSMAPRTLRKRKCPSRVQMYSPKCTDITTNDNQRTHYV